MREALRHEQYEQLRYGKERKILVFFAWIGLTILLWLGGGIDFRASAVISFVFALLAYPITRLESYVMEPQAGQGVYGLSFTIDIRRILMDLGIIDDSTNMDEIHALHKPDAQGKSYFPTYIDSCEWLADAKVFYWPSMNRHQSELKVVLFLQLPPECPLARTYIKKFDLQKAEKYCRVRFFIKNDEFGVRVPKKFVDARLKAGGLGDACLKSREDFNCGQFDLVVGHLPQPYFTFRHKFEVSMYPTFSARKHRQYLRYIECRTAHFESKGWTLKEENLSEIGIDGIENAEHKYMTIGIFNDE
jgi:hypothetical protein